MVARFRKVPLIAALPFLLAFLAACGEKSFEPLEVPPVSSSSVAESSSRSSCPENLSREYVASYDDFAYYLIMWDYSKTSAKMEVDERIFGMNVRCVR